MKKDLSYLITSLKIGNLYCTRVFDCNSTSFGKADDTVLVKTIQRFDPLHLLRLFHLTNADSHSIGTSLDVEWEKAMINNENSRYNMVDNRGSAIKNYLIECNKAM